MVAVMATAPPGQASESWFDAVKAGDLHSVRHLLAEAAHRDTNGEEARCEQGGTGLMWAAAEGRLEVLCELLSHSSLDLEARDRRAGGTALIWAASRNQVEALEVLLAHGACAGRPATLQNGGDSSKQPAGTAMGETALMVAAQYGNDAAVEVLAAAGHVEEANEYGQRALAVASMFGRFSCVRSLLRAGAQLEARDTDGATALCLAAEHGQSDAALLLLWHGADLAVATEQGEGTEGQMMPPTPLLPPPPPLHTAGATATAQMLRAWADGALLFWSRGHHSLFPAPFRADTRALLLATLGTSGEEQRSNPLAILAEHTLLGPLISQLLQLHMGGPPAAVSCPGRLD